MTPNTCRLLVVGLLLTSSVICDVLIKISIQDVQQLIEVVRADPSVYVDANKPLELLRWFVRGTTTVLALWILAYMEVSSGRKHKGGGNAKPREC